MSEIRKKLVIVGDDACGKVIKILSINVVSLTLVSCAID